MPGTHNTISREQHWNAYRSPCMVIWNHVMVLSHTYLISKKRIRFEGVVSASGCAIIMVVLLKMYVGYVGLS